MEVLRQDLRAAILGMRRAPGFATTALVTLALGVGATTAVFSIVHGVLLATAAVRESGSARSRLGRASRRFVARGQQMVQPLDLCRMAGSHANARRARRLLGSDYQVVTGGEGFKAFGARVSSAVLDTLGVGPALGRFLTDQDDRENAAPLPSSVTRCGASATRPAGMCSAPRSLSTAQRT